MLTQPLAFRPILPLLILAACATQSPDPAEIPRAPREFRAVWVATVANIDWPSKPGLTVEQQKKEAIAILDRVRGLNMNAVVFQVRPQADALYASELEPWSSYLTGEQGKAPDPFYDPLAFWVSEAHARGLELHAWFNPYRANHPANRGGISEASIVKSHPELVVELGDAGYYWMDPAQQEVQDHSVAVVLDVVRRYDIDGVHFDDYFYPYASYNGGKDFPDDTSWQAYQQGGGRLERGDWRRRAVDTFIERLYGAIKELKPHVELGISPFGIWRPGHPPSIRGFDQYAALYADAKRWLNEGWVDYFTPQLYWPIAQIPQSFPVLLRWWRGENRKGRNLWPGTTIGRARNDAGVTEILNQIMITRGMLADSPGICMFSMKSLSAARSELGEKLLAGPYAKPAVIPASPWLDADPPAPPVVALQGEGESVVATWKPRADDEVFLWVVYVERDGSWSHDILPASARSFTVNDAATVERIAVTAVDRCGNESEVQPVRAPRR